MLWNKINKLLFRLFRILVMKKGIYCYFGKDNHFSQGCLLYENAKIGNGNYFAPYVMINNAIIGNFCSIGPSCKIGLAEHDMRAVSTAPRVNNGTDEMKLFNLSNPSIIEHDVWIGANVVIKQGVKIGIGAVIGAGSIIIHDVPPYAIVVGIPGKIINYRFSQKTINKIFASNWFSSGSIKEAKEIICMQKVKDFL